MSGLDETSEKELRKQNPHKLPNKFQENTIAEANKRIQAMKI